MEITNDNLYKYQIPILKQLNSVVDKLEEKTKENYKLKIGSFKHTYFYNNNWITESGTLILNINTAEHYDEYYNGNFILKEYWNGGYNECNLTQILQWDIKIELDKDIFLKINQMIDIILKDNKERESYYNKLNNQLQAINNSL